MDRFRTGPPARTEYKPRLEAISENIGNFIRNKGRPKLYLRDPKDLQAPKYETERISEAAQGMVIITDTFLAGISSLQFLADYKRSQKENGFLSNVSKGLAYFIWRVSGGNTFEDYVWDMEVQESDNSASNIEVQPSLRNALAFTGYFKFLKKFLDAPNNWVYAEPLDQGIRGALEKIPNGLREPSRREILRALPNEAFA